MDSLTQILLGGAIAGAIAPARHRRAALLAGAVLGTLPDLDSIPLGLLTNDPVMRMTWHRGLSHSLLVLPFVAWAIWAWFRRRGGRVAQSPRRWWWVIVLVLITHPLLDAFTVYGTQLLWPLPIRPVMWSSLFIIDPMYSVWLLVGCVAAFFLRDRAAARYALVCALVCSTAYLGWSLLAKSMIEHQADRALAAMGLRNAPRFSVPTPLNTVLWRVVALTPDGYAEGFYSLIADHGSMTFKRYPSNVQALALASEMPAVRRLTWFNHGFQSARIDGDTLVVSDLRMGSEPNYFFSFALARDSKDGWQAMAPQQLPAVRNADALWAETWHRIWRRPLAPTDARDDPMQPEPRPQSGP